MPTAHAQDAMIRRHEKELEERSSAAQAIIANAQDGERDLNDAEKETLAGLRDRMGQIQGQLSELESTRDLTEQVYARAKQVDQAIVNARRTGSTEVEYRSTGHYLVDYIAAQTGSQSARERLEVFTRAAAHQKTSDNLGVIPDPIVGDVLNFIDASRPLVGLLGPRDMPSATWYRPKVTQHVTVGVQGSAGAAADEKAELVSQKMTISRLTGNAVTYGGYVNVSRQNIDFSQPSMMDAIVNDLAAQYAIETEEALGTALIATTNTVDSTEAIGSETAAGLASLLWTAAGNIYNSIKGRGRIVLGIEPSRLGFWGKFFAPVNPQNAQSLGFSAADFNSGLVGNISGIPVYVSSGLDAAPATTMGILFSTAAVEVYEQRVGALQATEPSVLGVQVAYAGYFTPMTVESGGIQELTNLA